MSRFLLLPIFISIVYSCSLPLDENKVPQVVRDSFKRRYSNVKTRWMHVDTTKYKVHFDKDYRKTTAVFGADGSFIEEEYEINVADLPAPIVKYINTKLSAAKISEAAAIIRSSGEKIFEAEVLGKDYFFTTEGKLINYKEAE